MHADLDETMRRFEEATERVSRAIPLHPDQTEHRPESACEPTPGYHSGCDCTPSR
jgi:hypothetical protein